MKTNFLFILITCIVIGMVVPVFAVSPDKNKGDKTKAENLTPSPLPPSPWSLHIVVLDPCDTTCPFNQCSSWRFKLQPATVHCEGVLAIPPVYITHTWCQSDYYLSIPDTIPCVNVSIDPNGCSGSFNPNTCCQCQNSPPCTLKICK